MGVRLWQVIRRIDRYQEILLIHNDMRVSIIITGEELENSIRKELGMIDISSKTPVGTRKRIPDTDTKTSVFGDSKMSLDKDK